MVFTMGVYDILGFSKNSRNIKCTVKTNILMTSQESMDDMLDLLEDQVRASQLACDQTDTKCQAVQESILKARQYMLESHVNPDTGEIDGFVELCVEVKLLLSAVLSIKAELAEGGAQLPGRTELAQHNLQFDVSLEDLIVQCEAILEGHSALVSR
jgi:hypothetical protein